MTGVCVFAMMNVLNEADLIVDAVKQLGEMPLVVVDSGSRSDATLDLVRFARYGIDDTYAERAPSDLRAKFLSYRRNWGLIKCKELGATHVLIVDPDERYKDGEIDALLRDIHEQPDVALWSVRYWEAQTWEDKAGILVPGIIPRGVNLYAHEPIECTDGGLGYYSFSAHEMPTEWMKAGRDVGKPMTAAESGNVLHYGTLLSEGKDKDSRDLPVVMHRARDPKDPEGLGFASMQVSGSLRNAAERADDLMREVSGLAQGRPMDPGSAIRFAWGQVELACFRGRFGQARRMLEYFRERIDHPDMVYLHGYLRAQEAIHGAYEGLDTIVLERMWADAERLSREAIQTPGCSKTEPILPMKG